MQRQLLRTVAILVVVASLGGVVLMRQAGRLKRTARAVVMDTTALPPPTDSASFVAVARAARDFDRRLRGIEPRGVRVVVYQPDSTGVVLRLEPQPPDSAGGVWVRVLRDGQTAVTPHRP